MILNESHNLSLYNNELSYHFSALWLTLRATARSNFNHAQAAGFLFTQKNKTRRMHQTREMRDDSPKMLLRKLPRKHIIRLFAGAGSAPPQRGNNHEDCSIV